jgi:hypothetical protein
MRFKLGLCALLAIGLATALGGTTHAAIQTVLSLAIDVSGSVDGTEYDLQMDGYAAAFNSMAIKNYLDAATDDVAVQVVFFGTAAGYAPSLTTFTILSDSASATAFSNTLANLARPFQGNTNIAAGINFARTAMLAFVANAANDVLPDARLIIDVSGDGEQNVTPTSQLSTAVTTTENAGITINGLAIVTPQFPNLDDYYNSDVITSDGFVIPADNFADFSSAVQTKILREITGTGEVPEPASIACWTGLVVGGLVMTRRRRKIVA